MKLDGLDYNTQREKLILPEYGRTIQNMVEDKLAEEILGGKIKAGDKVSLRVYNGELRFVVRRS